jgi:hypothetical protein
MSLVLRRVVLTGVWGFVACVRTTSRTPSVSGLSSARALPITTHHPSRSCAHRATLGPGFGGLWRFADPLAKKLLIRQLVVLGLLRIAPLRRLVPEKLLDPPAAIVPAMAVVALVSSAIFSRQGRPVLAKAVLHHLVAWGGIPVINESIGQMLEDVGDAGASCA